MDNAKDFNNDHAEHCDKCNSKQMGTEFFCNDAAGIATPVLWVCHRCENPPVLVAAYRKAKWFATFYTSKAKYYATTTKAERAAKRARFAAAKARINARRAADGRPLIGEK